jgi:hypothetical protein
LLTVLPEQKSKKHLGVPFIAHAGLRKGPTGLYM